MEGLKALVANRVQKIAFRRVGEGNRLIQRKKRERG